MPITYKIDPVLKVIVSTHIGDVPDDEFLASYQKLYSNPAADLSYNRLIDLRQTDSSKRSPEALQALARAIQDLYSNSTAAPKTAVIAPAILSFGFGRMYGAFSSTIQGEFVVFRSLESALAWLRLPMDYALTNAPQP